MGDEQGSGGVRESTSSEEAMRAAEMMHKNITNRRRRVAKLAHRYVAEAVSDYLRGSKNADLNDTILDFLAWSAKRCK